MDIIDKCLGRFGKYNVVVYGLIYLSKFPVAWHQLGIVFLAPKAEYTCASATPPAKDVCPCEKPEYDRGTFTNTLIMEYNLICDRTWMVSCMQSLLQLGVLLGSVIFGMIADRYGRRVSINITVLVMLLSGLGARYMDNFWAFTVIRMFSGAAVGGFIVVGFVIVMEITVTQLRPMLASITHIPFNFGHLSTAGIGYLFRDYRDFQLAISFPVVVLLVYFFLIPESPMWLLATSKTEKAIYILKRGAKMNGRPIDNIPADVAAFQALQNITDSKKGTIFDLFRTPNLRRNLICMSIAWMSVSYFFYGVSQYVGHMSGNVFLNVSASALVSMAGSIGSIILMRYFGRKAITIGLNLTSAVCMFLVAVVPRDNPVLMVLVCIGIMNQFGNFCVVYLFATELFPTIVRSNAMGLCSMMARIGSMIAPIVISLERYGSWCTPIAFGVAPIVAAAVVLFIPETRGCELMTTLEQGENFGKRQQNVRLPQT